MQYDGNGKLAEAIATLYGYSPKSQAKTAKLIKEAKIALGITSKSKRLHADVNRAIWQWHYDRENPVQDIKQFDNPVQSLDDAIVQNIKHDAAIYDVKQTDNDQLELLPNSDGQINPAQAPQNDAVYDIKRNDDIDSTVDDFKQIHFAVTIQHKGQPKRTTVMLEGYLVGALRRKHGLSENVAIRMWIEQAIKADSVRFDSDAPLTRQVKRLIIKSLV